MRAPLPQGRPGPPLRVAYILKRYPRLSETFIVNEILALEALGVHVRIFAAAQPDEEFQHAMVQRVQAQVTYTREAARGLAGSREEAQAAVIVAAVRDERISHLHAHFATSAAQVARLVSRKAGIPFSFTAHAKDIFLDTVDRAQLSDLLGEAAFVVAISDYHRTFLSALNPEARFEVVRNGLDLSRFLPGEDRSAAPVRPLILGVGRLVEKKGFENLLLACAELSRRGVSYSCRILGEGPWRPHLESVITTHELQDWCELPGAAPQEQVIAALREAHVLAVPCVTTPHGDRDGLPTVILEAMACGTPVVATPVTAVPEIVAHQRTGLLVPERDPDALAEALESILLHAASGRRLAAAARQSVAELHDVRRSAALLGSLFSGSAACR